MLFFFFHRIKLKEIRRKKEESFLSKFADRYKIEGFGEVYKPYMKKSMGQILNLE